MTNTPDEKVSEAIEKSSALILDEISNDVQLYAQLQAEKAMSVREAMEEYKQYLFTLDADLRSSIADLCEINGHVYITHPVEIDTINDMVLSHRAYNLLYGPPGTHNTSYPLFAIPKGKYRFMLIAIPAAGGGEDES